MAEVLGREGFARAFGLGSAGLATLAAPVKGEANVTMLLPSGAAVEHKPVPPPQFGMARSEVAGHAVHGLIYEHDYEPQPVRKFSEERPPDEECVGVLRPAIRHGRAPFRFYGLRVPASADHARCWLGRVLLQEISLGRLQHVELSVPPEPQAPSIQKPQPLKAHGQQPSWKWLVWVAGASMTYENRDPHVEVQMHCSPVRGIYIELSSEDEGCKCFVFRVLRQYCDDKCQDWHPIPESQASLSKVLDRHMSTQDQLNRVIGETVPQLGTDTLTRFVSDLKEAEEWLVQSLSRLEAAKEVATLKDLLIYMRDLEKALRNAHDVRFKLKPCYNVCAREALDLLLRKALEAGEDRELLAEVRDIATEMHACGVQEPDSLRKVLTVLEQ